MAGMKTSLLEGESPIREGLFAFDHNGKGPRLIGAKCTDCQDVVFPKRELCSACGSEKQMEEVFIGERGTLLTYTVNRVDYMGIKAPYIMGVVKLPEADELLVITQIEDCEVGKVKIGMPLSLAIGKIRKDQTTGKTIIGHKYRPDTN